MAEPVIDFFYSEGTITLTNGSDIAVGQFTSWDPAVLPYDFVYPNDGQAGISVVKEVLGVNQIRLAKLWAGPTLTEVPYFIVRWIKHTDPRIYGVRVSEYLSRLKDIPADIIAERDAAIAAIQEAGSSITALQAGNNLSDLADKATARTNLGVPALASNLSDLPDKAAARSNLGALRHGECRLVSASATTVRLDPHNGDRVIINGIERTIPPAGVTLAAGTLAAGSFRFIYAAWSGTAVVLSAGTGTPVPDSNGILVHPQVPSQTLVGMAYATTADQFNLVRSWSNDPGFYIEGPTIGTQTTLAGTSTVELQVAGRSDFLLWAGESVSLSLQATGWHSTAGTQLTSYVGYARVGDPGYTFQVMAFGAQQTGGQPGDLSGSGGFTASAAGVYRMTVAGRGNAANSNWAAGCRARAYVAPWG